MHPLFGIHGFGCNRTNLKYLEPERARLGGDDLKLQIFVSMLTGDVWLAAERVEGYCGRVNMLTNQLWLLAEV
jgi:hypothetical protein